MKKLYNIHTNKAIYTRVAETEKEAINDVINSWYYGGEPIEHIEIETSQKAVYNQLALSYAENHGVIEYHISGNTMIYYSSFPMEHSTIKAVVNLDTMKEKRHYLKNYYIAYKSLIGGKYQANYCI